MRVDVWRFAFVSVSEDFLSLMVFFFRCELVGALNCAVLIVDANLAFVFGALMVDADGYLCLLAGKPYVCLVFVVAVAASGPIRDGFSI